MTDWQDLLAATRTADPAEFRKLVRRARRLSQSSGPPETRRRLRLFLISASTLDLWQAPLELALWSRGLSADIRLAPYGSTFQQLLDPTAEAASFAPDVALVVLTAADIPEWPAPGATATEADAIASRVATYFLAPCQQFQERTGAELFVTNLGLGEARPFGNLGAKLPEDRHNFVRRVNVRLGDQASGGVHLIDLSELAARQGTRHAFDRRAWFESKQPVSVDLVPDIARGVANMIAASCGLARKCIVLDLDNTLWGGVIGDVGVGGIELGEGTPRGEAFKAFQQYLRGLRDRGVLLAVCSKNEAENAKAPFTQHAETVLGLADFAAFHASWDPKSDRIAAIAEELDLGLDALVFVDDNPAEREQVRQALPSVAVVDLPEDSASYPSAVEAAGWFETLHLTDEDRVRAKHYQSRAAARSLEKTMDLGDFLVSLEMHASVGPVDDRSRERAVQLLNKTNQFNLATRRYGTPEMDALLADPNVVTRVIRLRDRFGDHGLISLATARLDGESATIEDWLMSCRVLKREVEFVMMNELASAMAERGARHLTATFTATGRNELVRELPIELGFTKTDESNSQVHFKLSLADFEPLAHSIHVETEGPKEDDS